MRAVSIKRIADDGKETRGELEVYAYDRFLYACKTLELPWKGNENDVSCIPEGNYRVVPADWSKYGKHFRVLDVPNRSGILFHTFNYYYQTRGCIAVGLSFSDLNKDGELDITNSRKALDRLVDLCPEGFMLTIKGGKDDSAK